MAESETTDSKKVEDETITGRWLKRLRRDKNRKNKWNEGMEWRKDGGMEY